MGQSLFIIIVTILLTIFASNSSRPDVPDSPPPITESTGSGATGEAEAEPGPTGRGTVLAERTLLREAVDSGGIVGELQQGEEVTVLAREGEWWYVRDRAGRLGYVRDYLLEVVPHAAAAPIVLGYYMHTPTADQSLRTHVDSLTAISPWQWQVTPDGSLAADFPAAGTAAALAFAGRKGLETYALVQNFRDGAFDAGLAMRVLSSPEVRARLVEEIYRRAREWQITGVHIDFENVPAEGRGLLPGFMAELAARLRPEGIKVTMAVPASHEESASWWPGYDYAALAQHVDFMVVMTYDQHWLGGPPGPVAGIDWVGRVVDYLLGIGVPKEKLVLGIAGYGYDWSLQGNQWAEALTYPQVMARLERMREEDPSIRLQWDPQGHVPYFSYRDRIVYFENADSLSHKLQLVRDRGLAGVALWRLGQEDPGLWPLVHHYLGSAGRTQGAG